MVGWNQGCGLSVGVTVGSCFRQEACWGTLGAVLSGGLAQGRRLCRQGSPERAAQNQQGIGALKAEL